MRLVATLAIAIGILLSKDYLFGIKINEIAIFTISFCSMWFILSGTEIIWEWYNRIKCRCVHSYYIDNHGQKHKTILFCENCKKKIEDKKLVDEELGKTTEGKREEYPDTEEILKDLEKNPIQPL